MSGLMPPSPSVNSGVMSAIGHVLRLWNVSQPDLGLARNISFFKSAREEK
jgi:hypothetical protein